MHSTAPVSSRVVQGQWRCVARGARREEARACSPPTPHRPHEGATPGRRSDEHLCGQCAYLRLLLITRHRPAEPLLESPPGVLFGHFHRFLSRKCRPLCPLALLSPAPPWPRPRRPAPPWRAPPCACRLPRPRPCVPTTRESINPTRSFGAAPRGGHGGCKSRTPHGRGALDPSGFTASTMGGGGDSTGQLMRDCMGFCSAGPSTAPETWRSAREHVAIRCDSPHVHRAPTHAAVAPQARWIRICLANCPMP